MSRLKMQTHDVLVRSTTEFNDDIDFNSHLRESVDRWCKVVSQTSMTADLECISFYYQHADFIVKKKTIQLSNALSLVSLSDSANARAIRCYDDDDT